MSVWNYAERLPAVAPEHRLSLGEGRTPVVRSKRIGPEAGIENLYFKLEAANPTGSYKDRFAAVAVSLMLASGKTKCIATSSGNSGAALAAYCAAAQLTCEIAIVETAPTGKLLQMLAYGAQLKRIRSFGLDPEITRQTCELLESRGKQPDSALQITAYRFCPLGMQGVQTISYELAEFAVANDVSFKYLFVPAGGGGLALAIARGFVDWRAHGTPESPSPAVHVVQPRGNDTIASSLRNGDPLARAVDCSTSISGLQVPSVIDGTELIRASRESGGTGHIVDDESVWQVQSRLVKEEGIFCEPAAAVSVCGALNAVQRGEIDRNAPIACIITGSAFKDLASVERMVHGRDCLTVDFESF